ncbi:MAG: UxaA family hydrolase [Sporomusa sp.]
MKFEGFLRPDGTAGIRNHVLIIPSVVCANRVARGISEQVLSTTWVEHQHGCTQLGVDAKLTDNVLIRHGTHPNVVAL